MRRVNKFFTLKKYDSPGYQTSWSQTKMLSLMFFLTCKIKPCDTVSLKTCAKILRNGSDSSRVMVSDSPEYDTPGKVTPWGINYQTLGRFQKNLIARWILNQDRKYFKPLVGGPGRFEWRKKTRGRKSCWTVPLKVSFYGYYCHLLSVL